MPAGRTGGPVTSRARFIAGAAATGVVVVGGAAGAGLLAGKDAPSAESPLALALTLERLQAAFYSEAVAGGALRGELRDFAETAALHEAAHTADLGAFVTDRGEPAQYAFGDATSDADAFGEAAALLEDLAVSAYNGLIPTLSGAPLAAAARIVSVDARHAAWVRAIFGRDPAAAPSDDGMTPAQARAALAKTGFVMGLTP